jgi:hypothetical protein
LFEKPIGNVPIGPVIVHVLEVIAEFGEVEASVNTIAIGAHPESCVAIKLQVT